MSGWKNKQRLWNEEKQRQNPVLGENFTKEVIQRIQKRETIKDFLFMIVVGFIDIIKGFLKISVPAEQMPQNTNSSRLHNEGGDS